MNIGNDFYELLGQGVPSLPLSKEDPNYAKLMSKYNDLISTFRSQAEEHKIKVGIKEETVDPNDSGFKLKEEKTE